MSLSISLGISLTQGGGVSYSAEAQALFARFTTPPDAARKTLIDNLIRANIPGGGWANLDQLLVDAAADSQAARQNWVQDLYNSTAVSGPVFTADRGYTGDASTSYLNLGINLTTPGLKAQRDANSSGVYLTTGSGLSAADMGGSDYTVSGRNSSSITYRNASTSANSVTTPTANAVGWWSMIRAASGAYNAYFNGVSFLSSAQASSPFVSQTLFALARNNGAGVGTGFSDRRKSASYVGNLTPAQDETLRLSLVTYLTAVGAI